MKLDTKTVRFVLSSAAVCGAALTVLAAEAPTPAAQSERQRMVEKFQAGLQSSPARQKLDSVITPSDPMAGADAARSAPANPLLTPDARRLQLLEAEKKALVALSASNEGEINDLRLRLQRAESERWPTGFAFLLLALLAAGLGGLAYLGRSRRNVRPLGAVAPGHGAKNGDSRHGDARRSLLALQPLAALPQPAAGDDFKRDAIASTALADGSMTGSADVQPVNSELLLDIRQQAGFFLSLGQTEQAVRILERHILENGESSPAIYLHLLDILHENGLKAQFRKFREEFNLLFNGNVAEFSAFQDGGKDLESYPHVLAHIMALWPKSKVLRVIEAAIYRDPWDAASAPFELAAFRDLVLLHAIALGNDARENAVPGPTSGPMHGFARGPVVLDLDLDLDLDLTEPESKTALTAGVPSWSIDFQNIQPGLTPGPGHGGTPARPAVQMPAQPAVNLIDFELPPEDATAARTGLMR